MNCYGVTKGHLLHGLLQTGAGRHPTKRHQTRVAADGFVEDALHGPPLEAPHGMSGPGIDNVSQDCPSGPTTPRVQPFTAFELRGRIDLLAAGFAATKPSFRS